MSHFRTGMKRMSVFDSDMKEEVSKTASTGAMQVVLQFVALGITRRNTLSPCKVIHT